MILTFAYLMRKGRRAMKLIKNMTLWGGLLLMGVAFTSCGGTSTTGGGSTSTSANSCLNDSNATAATIPASIATTYNLTYNETNTGGPITAGTATTFVVGTDGSLTIDGSTTLTDPCLYRGNAQEAIWFDDTNNLAYSLSSLTLGFNEINVSNNIYYDLTGFAFYGQYR